jgi:MarR family transcriptional regulator, 2-MHQ and catechol-resistance regulon repressor
MVMSTSPGPGSPGSGSPGSGWPAARLDDDRLTLVGLFAEVFQAVQARLLDQLAVHGLSGVDFEVLVRLSRTPEGMLRMSDLAAQTTLTTSGATRVVDRLAAAGLVCRRACDLDRRSTYAVVTESGHSRVDEVLPGHLSLVSQMLVAPLRPVEREALESALRAVRDAVRPGATAGADGPVAAGDPAAATGALV